MVSIGLYERLECPEEFNELLRDTFGVNMFGDPIYRVLWGQTETMRVSRPEGGYQDQTLGGNLPAWLLQRWTPPEKWGTPQVFEYINKDPVNNQPLFPYPEFGIYETIHNLGQGVLDYGLFRTVFPMLEEIMYLSFAQLQAAKDRQKELENHREVEEITDRLMDALPTRYGPTSYGRAGCRTSVLDRKMAEIQQVWNRIDPKKLRHSKGITQWMPPEKWGTPQVNVTG